MARVSGAPKRATLAVLACAVLVVGSVAACDRRPRSGPAAPPGDVAVVLTQAESVSELAVVDLQRMREVRRVRLRSRCLSIDGDRKRRVIVTAQCGGVGPDADSAAGVIALEGDAGTRYIELGIPNPLDVAVSGPYALLVHGFEQQQGTVASFVFMGESAATVDARRPGEPRRIHVPASAGRPEAYGAGFVLPAMSDPARGEGSLRWLAPTRRTLESRVDSLTADAATIVAGQTSSLPSALVVVRDDRAGEWRIERHAAGGPSTRRTLPVPEKGYFAGCVLGNRIALADSDGLDPADPGRRIIVLDARTLDEVQRIELDGTPAAVSAWGERLVVADAQRGMLLVYEPGSATPARSLAIEGLDSGGADIVVFERVLRPL